MFDVDTGTLTFKSQIPADFSAHAVSFALDCLVVGPSPSVCRCLRSLLSVLLVSRRRTFVHSVAKSEGCSASWGSLSDRLPPSASVSRRISLTLHGAISKRIVGPSVMSAPWRASKVELLGQRSVHKDHSAICQTRPPSWWGGGGKFVSFFQKISSSMAKDEIIVSLLFSSRIKYASKVRT